MKYSDVIKLVVLTDDKGSKIFSNILHFKNPNGFTDEQIDSNCFSNDPKCNKSLGEGETCVKSKIKKDKEKEALLFEYYYGKKSNNEKSKSIISNVVIEVNKLSKQDFLILMPTVKDRDPEIEFLEKILLVKCYCFGKQSQNKRPSKVLLQMEFNLRKTIKGTFLLETSFIETKKSKFLKTTSYIKELSPRSKKIVDSCLIAKESGRDLGK